MISFFWQNLPFIKLKFKDWPLINNFFLGIRQLFKLGRFSIFKPAETQFFMNVITASLRDRLTKASHSLFITLFIRFTFFIYHTFFSSHFFYLSYFFHRTFYLFYFFIYHTFLSVVSTGRLNAFYVGLVPLEYFPSEPPHSTYVIVSLCGVFNLHRHTTSSALNCDFICGSSYFSTKYKHKTMT